MANKKVSDLTDQPTPLLTDLLYLVRTPLTEFKLLLSNLKTLLFTGTVAADNAAAGIVGEYVEGILLQGAAVPVVTGTGKTIISIVLTAGDWDIDGEIIFFPAATTSITEFGACIHTIDNTFTLVVGNFTDYSQAAAVQGNSFRSVSTPTRRVSINAPTTYYLVAFSVFSISTMTAFGIIRARRVR